MLDDQDAACEVHVSLFPQGTTMQIVLSLFVHVNSGCAYRERIDWKLRELVRGRRDCSIFALDNVVPRHCFTSVDAACSPGQTIRGKL